MMVRIDGLLYVLDQTRQKSQWIAVPESYRSCCSIEGTRKKVIAIASIVLSITWSTSLSLLKTFPKSL
ncbi:hypothetical protein ACB092_01G109500 [Castanea dentata]